MEKDLVKRTQKTAKALFDGPTTLEVPYHLWKEFDRDLAKDLSLFITGNLYSREVLPLPERQMVAVAALTALQKTEELKIHLHGALNVGVPPKKLSETIFQIGVYAGFPAVNSALSAFKEVLISRGQWPLPHDEQA